MAATLSWGAAQSIYDVAIFIARSFPFSLFLLCLCAIQFMRVCCRPVVGPAAPLFAATNKLSKCTQRHTERPYRRASNDARPDKSGNNKLSSHAFLFPFNFHLKRNPSRIAANLLTVMHADYAMVSPKRNRRHAKEKKKKHLFSIAIAVVFVAPLSWTACAERMSGLAKPKCRRFVVVHDANV